MVIINKLLNFITEIVLYEKKQLKLLQKIFLIKNNFLSFKQKISKQIYIYFVYYSINFNYFILFIYEIDFYDPETKEAIFKTTIRIENKNYLNIFFRYYKNFFNLKNLKINKNIFVLLKNKFLTLLTILTFNVK